MSKGIEVDLPVIKRSRIFGGKLKRKYKNEKFLLDMSLAAEERFDKMFPAEATKYGDLEQYTEIVRVDAKKQISHLTVRQMLRAVYCWFNTKYTFIEFLQLFDFSDVNYIYRLVDKLKVTFDLIAGEATEKN